MLWYYSLSRLRGSLMPSALLEFKRMEQQTPGLDRTDHDLLVRLNVPAENPREDLNELKVNLAGHVSSTDQRIISLKELIGTKADASDVEMLKQFRWWMAGIGAL